MKENERIHAAGLIQHFALRRILLKVLLKEWFG